MKMLTKRSFLSLLISGLLFGLSAFPANAQPPENNGNMAPRKIVVFQDYFTNVAAQNSILKGVGAAPIKHLRIINAMAAHLPPQAESALLKRLEILRIDDDLVIEATENIAAENVSKAGAPKPPPPQPSQTIPWGIARIKANTIWTPPPSPYRGLGINVAILDTGIDLNHADLQANIQGNVNIMTPTKSGDDDNGHGTHVAGIIAAVDNNVGVVGVGPQIYLYAVKVLDRRGSGWLSDIIAGLDWCIRNNIQVINMSLGSSGDNQSFYDAILKVYQADIIQVVAAGNNGQKGGAVDYPAKYPQTIAVSAVAKNLSITSGVSFASFSSYGPEVDLTAPGASILSTYNNGYYTTLSGTSMATPHVAGVVALVLATKTSTIWTPDSMLSYLQSKAENVGLSYDKQGAGLIRADLAVQ